MYQQGSQSLVKSKNDNKKSKQDLKIDDWDKESREYYQKHKANYGDLQMKQRFRRITRQRKYRAEHLDRRMRTENTTLWHIIKSQQKIREIPKGSLTLNP